MTGTLQFPSSTTGNREPSRVSCFGLFSVLAIFGATLVYADVKSPQASEKLASDLRRTNPLAFEMIRQLESEMVSIPQGSFLMGGKYLDETPSHSVNIKGFKLGKYEVTFAQYDVFAVTTGRKLPADEGWGRDNRPVINVSWDDAEAFAEWISKATGRHYRLPGEAEFEYAIRAGTKLDFFWSGPPLEWKNYANASPNMGRDQWDFTAPVGQFLANPFGLYDLGGNAYEWTADCYNHSYVGAPSDGSAWTSGDCSNRVIRGGSYKFGPGFARSSSRNRRPPGSYSNDIGFRLVCEF